MNATVGTDGWVEMTVLVTVKAYPSVSMKYGEAVCVAGTQPSSLLLPARGQGACA